MLFFHVYAITGSEHVIANMGVIPLGIMYGSNVSITQYIVKSVIPSLIGNWIGAAFLLGLPLVYLYAWESRSFKHVGTFLRFNLVTTTTLSEEWSLFCYKIWNDVTPTEIVVAEEYALQTEKYDSGKDVEMKEAELV